MLVMPMPAPVNTHLQSKAAHKAHTVCHTACCSLIAHLLCSPCLPRDALWLTEDTHPEGGCRMLPRSAALLTLGAETAAAAETPPPPPVLALGGGSL